MEVFPSLSIFGFASEVATMIKIEDLFTTEAAAEYLQCSILNVKKHLIGVLLHPSLRVYHRLELDHYKAQMGNPRKQGRTPYPELERLTVQIKTELMTISEAAEWLGMDVKRVYERLSDKVVTFPPTRRKMLRRSDVEALKARPA